MGQSRSTGRLLSGLGGLVSVFFLAALLVGPAGIAPPAALGALFGDAGGPMNLVMQEIRLPRAILGVLVGVSLGMAGAAMQGYLRNPLAEPGLIGVSGAAALGAVIALQTGLAGMSQLALPAMALAGAVLAVLAIFLLAGPRGSSLTLILAGIAISALTGAMTALVLNLSPNPFAASEIVFWTMGSLADRSFVHVWIAAPFMAAGWLMLGLTGRALDALTLGEDAARSMGQSLSRARLFVILGTASAVGASVAVAGAIGFVGLVVPHLLRGRVGGRPSALLWASALGGAAMLLAADLAVRVILPERDLKLGVLTAIVGAPLFLHLIYKTRSELP